MMSVKVRDFLDKFDDEMNTHIKNKKNIYLDSDTAFSEKEVERLTECVKEIKKHDKEYAKKILLEIVRKPSHENGYVYEALGYGWMYDSHMSFELQPEIKAINCFKKNSYRADGRIDGVVFDIKSFCFGTPRYYELENSLNTLIQRGSKQIISGVLNSSLDVEFENYYITVSGNADLSSDKMENLLREQPDILNKLFHNRNKRENADYVLQYDELGIEITAHFQNPDSRTIIFTESASDPYEWARNNQYQLLTDGSQFCRNEPYMVICVYDYHKAPMMCNINSYLCVAFRSLCRRMFTYHTRMYEKYLKDFDENAREEILVSDATRKLSAILFVNVSVRENVEDEVYLYINPNADHRAPSFFEGSYFNGLSKDNFMFDNY